MTSNLNSVCLSNKEYVVHLCNPQQHCFGKIYNIEYIGAIIKFSLVPLCFAQALHDLGHSCFTNFSLQNPGPNKNNLQRGLISSQSLLITVSFDDTLIGFATLVSIFVRNMRLYRFVILNDLFNFISVQYLSNSENQ